MSSKKRLLAVAMATLLFASAVASAGAVTSTAADDSVANDSLVVTVDQAGNDGATVTVAHDDSAVANASVTVTDESNGTYAGVGNHTTDANGTVSLPEPEENVTVEVTAANGNLTGETTATLTAAVEEADEDEDPKATFGQMVSSFVQEMLNAGSDDGAIGQKVSDFVTSNNPGSEKKPDHAGKPADASESDAGSKNATDDGERGPPEHAGQSDGEEDDGDDDEEEKNGDRGNGKKNGHGKDKTNGKDH